MSSTKDEMLPRQIKKGELIYQKKQLVSQIAILAKGKIKATGKFGEFDINSGSFVGAVDAAIGTYVYDYIAEEDSVVFAYHYEQYNDIERLLNQENSGALVSSLVSQTMLIARYYEKLIHTCGEIYEFCKK